MDKRIKAVKSKILSDFYDTRYVICDVETGEILDDAQGYGYKSMQKAYAAWNYKNRDKSKDKEKEQKQKIVRAWMKEHPDFVGIMEADMFCIAKGSYAPDDIFNIKWVKNALTEFGYHDLPFTARELHYALTHSSV